MYLLMIDKLINRVERLAALLEVAGEPVARDSILHDLRLGRLHDERDVLVLLDGLFGLDQILLRWLWVNA
jgi:hypothetical protein